MHLTKYERLFLKPRSQSWLCIDTGGRKAHQPLRCRIYFVGGQKLHNWNFCFFHAYAAFSSSAFFTAFAVLALAARAPAACMSCATSALIRARQPSFDVMPWSFSAPS